MSRKLSSTKTTTNEGLKCAIDHILDAQQKGEINEDNVLYIVENINVAGKWGPHFPSLLIFTTATQCHAFYCFTQFFREVIMGNANGASLKIFTWFMQNKQKINPIKLTVHNCKPAKFGALVAGVYCEDKFFDLFFHTPLFYIFLQIILHISIINPKFYLNCS